MSLATFLSSCPSLAKFILMVEDCEKVVVHPEDWKRITSHVKEVQFSFVRCRAVVVSSVLDAIHFPAVRRMRLLCNSRGVTNRESDVHCQKVLRALFSTRTEFTDLEHFEFEVREGLYSLKSLVYTSSDLVSILLRNLPHLRSLRLSTWSSPLEALPDDINLTKLTRLEISNCQAMEFSWFEQLFKKIAAHRRHLGDGVMVPPLVVTVANAPWEEKALDLIQNPPGSNTIGGPNANAHPAEHIMEDGVVVPSRE